MTEKRWRWPIQLSLTIKPLSERQAVTAAIFMLAAGMFLMARENPKLWDIELFKIILQAVIISGIIGSILAFHFSANKGDETKTENTAKAFEAITATATAASAPPEVKEAASIAADQVAEAASAEAERIAS
jgi:hypothetical protein